MSKRYGSVEWRFLSNINFGLTCWEWLGCTSEGYGRFRAGKTKVRAHRYALERKHGPLPPESVVRHKCDNPLCVNPSHLDVGTHADNVRDMDDRDRRSVGEEMPGHKLNEKDIHYIRSSSLTQRALGNIYGVSHTIIGRIKRGEDWKHV